MAKSADAVLLGPIGGLKWGTGKLRPEQGLLKLRRETGTFSNLRPCYFPSPKLIPFSPLKAEICTGTDILTVRELTGGLYFGERIEANPEDGADEWAEDCELYSRKEIERITRLAAHLALSKDPPRKVWSLDKANVLAASRLWRRTVTNIMKKEFPKIEFEHQLVDSAAMKIVRDPRSFNGILLTSNLFGDLISDEASAIPGPEGCLPSASLSGIPDDKTTCYGIYEPAHGPFPDLCGKGTVNPIGAILSGAMLLMYSLNRLNESKLVEKAVRITIDKDIVTRDLGGKFSTEEVGDSVARELELLFERA